MKCALITGVSQGLGLALVKTFLEKNFVVFGISRSEQVQVAHSSFHLITTDWEDYDLVVQRIQNVDNVKIDVVIHNAGLLINKDLDDLSESDFLDSYKVNVVQPFLLTKALKKAELLQSDAHIIHIGSVGGVAQTKKFAGFGAYSSSKASLSVLTEIMQLEWGQTLNFNTLALGAVKTSMLDQANFSSADAFSDVQLAGWIHDFAQNSVDFISGQTILIKKSDPV